MFTVETALMIAHDDDVPVNVLLFVISSLLYLFPFVSGYKKFGSVPEGAWPCACVALDSLESIWILTSCTY